MVWKHESHDTQHTGGPGWAGSAFVAAHMLSEELRKRAPVQVAIISGSPPNANISDHWTQFPQELHLPGSGGCVLGKRGVLDLVHKSTGIHSPHNSTASLHMQQDWTYCKSRNTQKFPHNRVLDQSPGQVEKQCNNAKKSHVLGMGLRFLFGNSRRGFYWCPRQSSSLLPPVSHVTSLTVLSTQCLMWEIKQEVVKA